MVLLLIINHGTLHLCVVNNRTLLQVSMFKDLTSDDAISLSRGFPINRTVDSDELIKAMTLLTSKEVDDHLIRTETERGITYAIKPDKLDQYEFIQGNLLKEILVILDAIDSRNMIVALLSRQIDQVPSIMAELKTIRVKASVYSRSK